MSDSPLDLANNPPSPPGGNIFPARRIIVFIAIFLFFVVCVFGAYAYGLRQGLELGLKIQREQNSRAAGRTEQILRNTAGREITPAPKNSPMPDVKNEMDKARQMLDFRNPPAEFNLSVTK